MGFLMSGKSSDRNVRTKGKRILDTTKKLKSNITIAPKVLTAEEIDSIRIKAYPYLL